MNSASDSDVKKHQPTKQKYSLNSKSMKNLSEMESNLCEKEQIYEVLYMFFINKTLWLSKQNWHERALYFSWYPSFTFIAVNSDSL